MTVMDGTVRIWDHSVKLGARSPQKILMSYTDLPIGSKSSVKTTLMIINGTKQMNNVNMQNDGRAVELEFLKVLASDNFDLDRLKIAIFLFLTALKQRLK